MVFSTSVSNFNAIKDKCSFSEYILESQNQCIPLGCVGFNVHFSSITICTNPNTVILFNERTKFVINNVSSIDILDENSLLGLVFSINFIDENIIRNLIFVAR